MFEKNMKLAYLLDFYIDVLDEHAQDIMRAYYEDDLSLAEIAAGVGISRQGIRHVIKKSEEQILTLEAKLKLAERHTENEGAIERLKELSAKAKDGTPPSFSELDEVIAILEKGV